MTLVDVIIPTFNSARFVEEALESVFRQDIAVHIFVVDDGSSDGTLDHVPASARITKISQPNAGPAAARNTGIEAGCAPFVAFLDADDLWMREKLSRQVASLGPEDVLSCTDFCDFDDAGITRASMTLHHRPCSGHVLPHLLRDNFLKTSTVLVRRSALPGRRPFDESLRFCEDRDLFYRLAARGSIRYEPAVLTAVRGHDDNVTRDIVSMMRFMARVYEKTLTWIEGAESRRLVTAELVRVYNDLGFMVSEGDLAGSLHYHLRALRHGGGLGTIRRLGKAPLRRVFGRRV